MPEANTPATPKYETSQNPVTEVYSNLEETTFFKSPMVIDSYKPPFNPDDLWQKYGDYRAYEEMVKDDQVSVCLRIKKDLVLGEGGFFQQGEEGQQEIVEDLETAFFEDYEGDFITDIEEILTGYEFGFSITEKIFKIRDNMMLGLKKLKTRHPNSWRLHQDDKGNITEFMQITSQGDKDINQRAITHYINDSKFQNPYGNSDLRPAYEAWFTKRQVTKYFAIFLEKAASPVPIAKFDKNAPQNAIEKIFEALKRFQTKTALVIPKDIDVEFLEAKNTGEAYAKAINLFNMVIGRSLFIPDLLGFTGGETSGGSLALGKEQMALFFKHILRRRAALEAIINRQYVWPIVLHNFGFIKNYPKFRFKPLNESEATELAKLWLEAVKGKAYKPNPEEINHFRSLVKFPEGDVEFEAPAPNPFSGLMNNDESEEEENKDGKEGAQNAEKETSEEDDKESSDNQPPGPGDKKSFAKIYSLPSGDYHKKVNFKSIETKLNDYDNSVMNEAAPVVKRMLNDLMDQIERKKILQTQNTERIDTLSLKYKKDLKQILKSSFMQIYKDAQSQASSEILKSDFAKPLTSQKFLDVIEDETFKFVGDYEYTILKRVRSELIAAIKDGASLSAVQDILDKELKQMSEVQIERFARTKHTEVLNNARVDFFDNSGVVAAYQYSAVLDDVTSDICRGLDGKIFEAGNQPIPPMHFNCRSTLIPITKYESYKPTETIKGQSVDDFIEENKGAGFSRYTQKEPQLQITDPDVDLETTHPDKFTNVYTYSKDGVAFYEVTVVFEDEYKTSQKSIKNKRIK